MSKENDRNISMNTLSKILPILAGLLFSFSFSGWGSGFGAVLAFVVLLQFSRLSKKVPSIGASYFGYVYGSFLLFNAISCGWLINVSLFGGLSEIVINSAFMTVPWFIHRKASQLRSDAFAKLMLIVSWLSFEYIHTYWELQWPWLSLGNAFATETVLVQWYEFTGVLGGTAWCLLLACSIDSIISSFRNKSNNRRIRSEIFIFSILLVFPIVLSNWLLPSQATGKKQNILVVQPNFDAYTHNGLSPRQQVDTLLRLTTEKLTPHTNAVLWPEVSISSLLNEQALRSSKVLKPVFTQSVRFPQTDFIIGVSTYKTYQTKETVTARKFLNKKGYYDAFNTLLHIRNGQVIDLRHKSKLVIGVEKIPFPELLHYASRAIDWLGGSTGSLGSDTTLRSFILADRTQINSLICYESVFGAYATTNQPALLTIHTNDGWWGDTQGHKQHFSFSRLRAIENRTYVARTAYCGISGIIDPSGNVCASIPYGQKGSLALSVYNSNTTTFYQQQGDFIGRWATFFTILLLLFMFVSFKTQTKTSILNR